MKISVVGTGYVGLVAGVCFADSGHQIICVDKDPDKIKILQDGISPIYEPGLEDIMWPAIKAERIAFTTDLASAVQSTQVIFIAVGTPELPDGSADMAPTMSVVDAIAKCADAPKFVVLKSTVPVGTAKKVSERFKSLCNHKIEVISNPEFLKEGAAIDDFLKPDRIVIGCSSPKAESVMREIYEPFVKNGHPIVFMDNPSAELTKYAANAFLSVKISFINELARLADKVGADIVKVKEGFTSDSRINPAFFYPGIGFGGSCFPKDVKALMSTGEAAGVSMKITAAADEVNDSQKLYLSEVIRKHYGNLTGLRIAVWGLSFKPRTDDVREAPALHMIQALTQSGAHIVAFDPIASENALKSSAVKFEVAPTAMSALKNADGLLLATEWNEFRSPNFDEMASSMKQKVIFDGRNIFDPVRMKELGFKYYCIGRQAIC